MDKNWFVKMILEFLIIVFLLQLLNFAGIEFNEYPHKTIILKPDSAKIFREIAICTHWEGGKFVKIDFKNNSNICNELFGRVDINEERLIFFEDYQIIIQDIDQFERTIKIEIIYLHKSAITMNGRSII